MHKSKMAVCSTRPISERNYCVYNVKTDDNVSRMAYNIAESSEGSNCDDEDRR